MVSDDFLTRGKQNVETQFFLLAFAFNIEKLCNRTRKGRNGLHLLSLSGGLFLFFRRKRGREYKKDLIHPKMKKVFSFFIPFSLLFYPLSLSIFPFFLSKFRRKEGKKEEGEEGISFPFISPISFMKEKK